MRSAPAWQGRVSAAHTILREFDSIAAAGHPLDKKTQYGMWEWGVR